MRARQHLLVEDLGVFILALLQICRRLWGRSQTGERALGGVHVHDDGNAALLKSQGISVLIHFGHSKVEYCTDKLTNIANRLIESDDYNIHFDTKGR